MIFFDGIEVKITGGDFKGLMDITEVRNKSEFKVQREDLKADGGLIEILHAVNGANSTHAQELGITCGNDLIAEDVNSARVSSIKGSGLPLPPL